MSNIRITANRIPLDCNSFVLIVLVFIVQFYVRDTIFVFITNSNIEYICK